MKVLLNARYLASQATGIETTLLNVIRAFHGDQGLPMADSTGSREWADGIELILRGAPKSFAGICQCIEPDRIFPSRFFRSILPPCLIGTGEMISKAAFDLRGVAQGVSALGADAIAGPSFTVPLKSDIPRICFVYDLSFLTHPYCYDYRTRLFQNEVIIPSIVRSEGIIAISRATADEVSDILNIPEHRIHVACPPVAVSAPGAEMNSGNMPAELNEVLRGVNAGKIIVSVGTIQPRKNLVRLLRAFSSLSESLLAETILIIAGRRGWMCDDFDTALGKLPARVQSKVIVTGYLDAHALRYLLSRATVMAYPSLTEGFGLPPLEALAAGVPSVVGKCAATLESCGDAVQYVDSLDVDSIACGLCSLLTDSELRADLIRKGERVIRKYTLPNFGRSLARAFHSIAGK
ncbi:MAG: hypothetical protein CVV64_07535 [Candidatus Wallbacteria bacterium HGW-Wallbacteria-1]|jgi:alpha-1,3-rhamnosyl/mannosyltransferase|uniref:Glycosyl transferase family 1 domain-containing protein n=1 Tax=Candidatus Wallbacteria bacterium HGW-Wallbacteria-1 TaxID=2013854 RepID=A0A2N1PR30_9BACT|nr:MAG: hypothetical protein CVV64_07535 [Candidatus Wallbacteria bacterium HGW-Wallbacteria-1]